MLGSLLFYSIDRWPEEKKTKPKPIKNAQTIFKDDVAEVAGLFCAGAVPVCCCACVRAYRKLTSEV